MMQLMFAMVCAFTTLHHPVETSRNGLTIKEHPDCRWHPELLIVSCNKNYSVSMRRNLHLPRNRNDNRYHHDYQYLPPQSYQYFSSRGLISFLFGKNATRNVRHAFFKGVAVGGKIIKVPLLQAEKVVNGGSYIASLGVDFSRKVIGEIESAVGDGWEAIKAVKLPGFYTVLYFVGGIISVVSEIEKTIWFIRQMVEKVVSAAQAFGIYASLKLVSGMLGPVMRTLHLDCVPLRQRVINIDKFLVDELQTADGSVCGISKLHPIKNVTIMRNDRSFLIVKVPYAIDNLKIAFKAVNVTNFSGLLLENAPMQVTMKRMLVEGRVSFQAGTLIRFMTIRLKVVDFVGFRIKINQENDRTNIMDIIESIDEVLAEIIRKTVNKKLLSFDERISKMIGGK